MTSRSPRKRVDALYCQGRLRAAGAAQVEEAARLLADLENFALWAEDLL